jgi:hypothetical protein
MLTLIECKLKQFSHNDIQFDSVMKKLYQHNNQGSLLISLSLIFINLKLQMYIHNKLRVLAVKKCTRSCYNLQVSFS